MNLFKYLNLIVQFVLIFACSVSVAQTQLTPAQINQFKQLSYSEKVKLAQSLGINISDLTSLSNVHNIGSQAINENSKQNVNGNIQNSSNLMNDAPNVINSVSSEKVSTELPIFGFNAFIGNHTLTSSLANEPIPENYILAPGDVLNIKWVGKQTNNLNVLIEKSGKVIIPDIGIYSAAGITFSEFKKVLETEISNKILGVSTAITLAELRAIKINIYGEVQNPGTYYVNALTRITDVIRLAGGFSEIGSMRSIQLLRMGNLISNFDLYSLLIYGDSSHDSLLKSGDVIFIPPAKKRVSIKGEIKRPAIYEINKNETLKDLIRFAGGIKPSGYKKRATIQRYNGNNQKIILNVNLKSLSDLSNILIDGDVINVPKSSDRVENSIVLVGAVSRPGMYQWTKSLSLSSLFGNVESDLLPDADLSYSLIIRNVKHDDKIEVIQFSISNLLSSDPTNDIKLAPKDKIVVFSKNELKQESFTSLLAMAKTKAELKEQEKNRIIEKYNEKEFVKFYNGDLEDETLTDPLQHQLEQASESIASLTGEQKKENYTIDEYNEFSRKRLLAPIIEQLKSQGRSGEPIQLVEIDGEVKYPGIYPLPKNGKVSDLIIAAGGILESAFMQRLDLNRIESNGGVSKIESIPINLKSALELNSADNILLKSKDRLNIHRIPSWQETRIVELRGEFKFPGKYTIKRGESLSSLIQRVGGYSKYAYLPGSVFTRERLKQIELQNLLKVSSNLRMEIASKSLVQNKNNQLIDYSQAKQLLADLTKVKPVGRLVVDLNKLESDKTYDISLEDGDVLYVPTKQNSVNVMGQVQVATSHIFQTGYDVNDYIQLSGGIKKRADKERIYIIRANGSIYIPHTDNNWFTANTSENNILPGDTIVVPLDSEYMDNLELWSTATQIIYQGAVAIAAIARL